MHNVTEPTPQQLPHDVAEPTVQPHSCEIPCNAKIEHADPAHTDPTSALAQPPPLALAPLQPPPHNVAEPTLQHLPHNIAAPPAIKLPRHNVPAPGDGGPQPLHQQQQQGQS